MGWKRVTSPCGRTRLERCGPGCVDVWFTSEPADDAYEVPSYWRSRPHFQAESGNCWSHWAIVKVRLSVPFAFCQSSSALESLARTNTAMTFLWLISSVSANSGRRVTNCLDFMIVGRTCREPCSHFTVNGHSLPQIGFLWRVVGNESQQPKEICWLMRVDSKSAWPKTRLAKADGFCCDQAVQPVRLRLIRSMKQHDLHWSSSSLPVVGTKWSDSVRLCGISKKIDWRYYEFHVLMAPLTMSEIGEETPPSPCYSHTPTLYVTLDFHWVTIQRLTTTPYLIGIRGTSQYCSFRHWGWTPLDPDAVFPKILQSQCHKLKVAKLPVPAVRVRRPARELVLVRKKEKMCCKRLWVSSASGSRAVAGWMNLQKCTL